MADSLFDRLHTRSNVHLILIVLATVGAITINFYSLMIGVTIVVSHLLYIPIILVAFFYPKRGVPFAVGISVIYLLMFVVVGLQYTSDLISAGARCIVFIIIAAVVSYLSYQLNEEQKQLKYVKDEWERTFDSVPDLISLIDLNHRILRINKATSDRLRISPEKIVGLRCYEVIHQSQSPPIICPHSRLLQDRKEHTVEVHEDNLGGDFLVTCSPLYDSQGKMIGSVHIARDITNRKKVDRALKESERFVNSIVENIPDMIFVKDAEELRFIRFNKAGEDLVGFLREDMYGKNDYDLFPKDEADHFIKKDREVLQSKQYSDIPEEKILTKFRGERILHTKKIPILNEEGKPQYLLGISEDITERKRSEKALKESEEKFRTLVENLNVGLYRNTTDEKDAFLWSNTAQAHILGYESIEEFLKVPVSSLYPTPNDRKQFLEDLKIHGSLKNRIMQIKKKDGTLIWVSVNVTAKYTGKGEIEWIDGIIEDITDRKAMEEAVENNNKELVRFNQALAQANKKLNILSSITRHDILNQITALLAYVQLSGEMTKDPLVLEYNQKQIKIIQAIERQIEFTRYYQDIGVRNPEWEDVKTTSMRAAAQLPLGGVSISLNFDRISIYADPLIEKVFYNLMENSIRHGEHVNAIIYSMQETQDGLTIVYEDNGIGIPPENKEKIFHRGFGNHTGLGLFLIREILSITGIHIIETGEFGKGARFEIIVPKGVYRLSSTTTNTR
ncbi:MAG: PAS domain S-box protein [Methanoregulaceae archaeon]|jgi:PAS domain S-box-containing protein